MCLTSISQFWVAVCQFILRLQQAHSPSYYHKFLHASVFAGSLVNIDREEGRGTVKDRVQVTHQRGNHHGHHQAAQAYKKKKLFSLAERVCNRSITGLTTHTTFWNDPEHQPGIRNVGTSSIGLTNFVTNVFVDTCNFIWKKKQPWTSQLLQTNIDLFFLLFIYYKLFENLSI